MAKRSNHYEAAFEEFLRRRQIPYVAVDEKKRALLGDASLKSLDFIVSPALGGSWLIDVKGRRFPAGGQKQYWKTTGRAARFARKNPANSAQKPLLCSPWAIATNSQKWHQIARKGSNY